MEALQKMSDAKLTDCPACQAPALQKQLTAAAFKLKGSGWYETDFKNSRKKPAPKVEANAEDKTSATSNTKESTASV